LLVWSVTKLEERLLVVPNIIKSIKDEDVCFKEICLIDSMVYVANIDSTVYVANMKFPYLQKQTLHAKKNA